MSNIVSKMAVIDLQKLFRFGLSGLIVTGLHTLVAIMAITMAQLSPAIANGLAFLIATLCSYQLNTRWSFSAVVEQKNFYRFSFVSAIGLFLAVSISGTAEHFGFNYLIGIAMVVCIVPIMSFLFHNFWTYK